MSAPSTWTVTAAVGKVTFTEIIRDKILYNIILIAFLLFGVGFLAARLSFVRPERVILDFGVSALNLSCAAIAILTGASLLGKEIERRTIFVALSHPISKPQFVLGKFMGLSGVLTLNWILLSSVYLIILTFVANSADVLSATLFTGLLLLLIQSLVIASAAILISTFSTASISVIISIGLYLIGNNVSQIRLVAARVKSPLGSGVLNTASTLLPNFEYFNLGTKITYGIPLSWQFTATSLLYGTVVCAIYLALAGLLIQNKEV